MRKEKVVFEDENAVLEMRSVRHMPVMGLCVRRLQRLRRRKPRSVP